MCSSKIVLFFYNNEEPESVSRERNKTWTAGYAQQNDIRQAVRLAKNKHYNLDNSSSANKDHTNTPNGGDAVAAFGLFKNMRKFVMGKSHNSSSSKSKNNQYSKTGQTVNQQTAKKSNNNNNSEDSNSFKPDKMNFPRL